MAGDELVKGRVPLTGTPLTTASPGTAPAPSGAASGSYAATISADNPLAWWRLNDLAGTTAVDSTTSPANGTYVGTVSLGRAGVSSGNVGGGTSVGFGNSGSYVTVGALPAKLQLAIGTDFSLEGWVYIDTAGADALITEAYAGDGTVRYMLGLGSAGNGSGFPSFGWYNGGWRQAVGTVSIADSKWHHLVGTYEASANKQRLYVDGVEVASATPGGSQPGGVETLYLGRRWDSNQSTNGFLDELAIYGYRLSSTQVAAHAAAKAEAGVIGAGVTEVRVESVVADSSPELRVTEVRVETVVRDTTPELRVTEVTVEAVVQQWAHYFGILGDTNDDVTYTNYTAGGSNPTSGGKGKGRSKVAGGVQDAALSYRKNVDYRNNSDYRG